MDFYASEPHFVAHIAPVARALPEQLRGRFYVPRALARHAERHGVTPTVVGTPKGKGPVVVASYGDLIKVRSRPVVFVEHGIGQHYSGAPGVDDHPGYSGGLRRDPVRLFLCPNEAVAARNAAAYPHALTAVVGSPRLDRWPAGKSGGLPIENPTVAVSHHWPLNLVPETRSTFDHYKHRWAWFRDQVISRGGTMIGHSHPRGARDLSRFWASIGVEYVDDFEDVCNRAQVLCLDNSSALYESALDRPVIVLNAPWYRRDVEHGLRFWDMADVGVQVDDPDDLADALDVACAELPEVVERRRAITDALFPHRGESSKLAALAIVRAWESGGLLPAPPRRSSPFSPDARQRPLRSAVRPSVG